MLSRQMSVASLPAVIELAHFGAPSAGFSAFYSAFLSGICLWNVLLSESFVGWCTFVTFIVT